MRYLLTIISCCLSLMLTAQNITGKVMNGEQELLIGATVYWSGTTIGTTTDLDGYFEISKEGQSSNLLIASYVGIAPDTIEVTDTRAITFQLNAANTLDEVTISGQQDAVIISSIKAIKTEQITQTSLKQAACCDLAGCFGGQSSVQPHTTNVVTNAKELRILGLSGVYNQVLLDGFPMVKGLSATYGISSIPGTLVDNIFIAKGANSVLQGYESISGQINVQTKNPSSTDKLLINGYLNSFMEKHFNINYAFKKGDWNSLASFGTVQPAKKIDGDQDTFLDLPILTRYVFSNKWTYGNSSEWGWNSQINVRFLNEERIGGQTNFNPSQDQGSSFVYGQTVQFNQPELSIKTGYRWDDVHNVTAYVSGFQQHQHAYFGLTKYDADQVYLYGNLQYEYTYKEKQVLKTGFSYRYSNLTEDLAFTTDILSRTYAGPYQLKEKIPGFFAENTLYLLEDKLTWMAGIRGDHHNQFGFHLTPRTLLKYAFSPETVVRANIGTGWRTVNLFSENIGLLVSSRDIVIADELAPERALNYGLNFTHKIVGTSVNGVLSLDYYRTNFKNQIFPDFDTDPQKAIIQNFRDKSISNGYQAEITLNLRERFDWKVGYTYLDVYRMVDGLEQQLPFNAKHKVITTFSFQPLSKKYHFDTNIHWYGQQRLPNTQQNPVEFQRPDFSETYAIANAQFTYNLKPFELYAGCENIFNFRQNRAIISWEDPFSPYFDTSSVWGPSRGREFYLGFRYRILE